MTWVIGYICITLLKGIPSQLGGWKEWSMEGLDPSYTLPVHAVRKLAKSQREEEEVR